MTGPFWRSASPAACADPRSSAWTAGRDQTEDGSGWVEIFPEGALLTIRGKTGWREVEIGRGSTLRHLPGRPARDLAAARADRPRAPVPGRRAQERRRRIRTADGQARRPAWSRRCALAAGLRGDLTEGERRLAFGGHSLRAGLASSAQIEEAHVQKHLGHASAEMTRRYQRKRDRFTINLTKAAGL